MESSRRLPRRHSRRVPEPTHQLKVSRSPAQPGLRSATTPRAPSPLLFPAPVHRVRRLTPRRLASRRLKHSMRLLRSWRYHLAYRQRGVHDLQRSSVLRHRSVLQRRLILFGRRSAMFSNDHSQHGRHGCSWWHERQRNSNSDLLLFGDRHGLGDVECGYGGIECGRCYRRRS